MNAAVCGISVPQADSSHLQQCFVQRIKPSSGALGAQLALLRDPRATTTAPSTPPCTRAFSSTVKPTTEVLFLSHLAPEPPTDQLPEPTATASSTSRMQRPPVDY
ncbi:hypothetical protein HGRIS_006659 [Hohenbuehelia grisea]|uniref:Uncharacterized protein n=1 Tax=Hohenbuehelia grisea TaxID=104357 RepID=A0ABR3JA70_9AGAR